MGNSALLKCEIPSFVADFVSVANWIDNDGIEYFPSNNHNGTQIQKNNFEEMGHSKKQFLEPFKKLKIIFFAVVAQTYTTDANKNYVILGNSALVKCEIPSFVADFVSVVSWLDNDGMEYFPSNLGTFKQIFGQYTSNLLSTDLFNFYSFFQLLLKHTILKIAKFTSSWEIQLWSNVTFQVL